MWHHGARGPWGFLAKSTIVDTLVARTKALATMSTHSASQVEIEPLRR